MKFTKMQGIGNDFILVNDLEDLIPETEFQDLALAVCDRHFGIGADGLILILPSTHADYRMRIINSDGTEAEMCGNGIRCFARYIYEHIDNKKDVISVETLAGIIVPTVITEKGTVIAVEVDMGKPILSRSEIPMIGEDNPSVINETLNTPQKNFTGTAVSMGNPHFIIFVENASEIPVSVEGPLIENHSAFPQKTNAEFIQVVNRQELIMRVWERGSGETLACGTGACASLVAAVLNDRCDRKATIHLAGGDLTIDWQQEDDHVIMTGPAETVFEGEWLV